MALAIDLFLLEEKVPVEKIIDEGTIKAPVDKKPVEENTNTPIQIGEKEEDLKPEEKPNISEKKTSTAKGEYRVKSGDTLFLIAKSLKLDVQELKLINQLQSDHIEVGQVLRLSKAINKKTNPPQDATSRGASREDELYWLSRIIHAEAQGEPYEGKVAVGNVILNRIKSKDFPNTVYGVVFDVQYGYTQFSPVIDGSIYNTPNEESIRAAKAALNGERPVGDALYFLNPKKATNFWIVENRKFFMTIGDHDFYH